MRIIQISDTHLSPGKPHFLANWPPLAAWIAAQHADLVIHTGDVTVDGVEVAEDLVHAAELMRQLGGRLRAVPGNHDVGDTEHPRQPVDDRSLAHWRGHFGPTVGSRMSRAFASSVSALCSSAAATSKRRRSWTGWHR
jgi:3',5'-cyclic AMP phosphodiesterase CpdA